MTVLRDGGKHSVNTEIQLLSECLLKLYVPITVRRDGEDLMLPAELLVLQ